MLMAYATEAWTLDQLHRLVEPDLMLRPSSASRSPTREDMPAPTLYHATGATNSLVIDVDALFRNVLGAPQHS